MAGNFLNKKCLLQSIFILLIPCILFIKLSTKQITWHFSHQMVLIWLGGVLFITLLFSLWQLPKINGWLLLFLFYALTRIILTPPVIFRHRIILANISSYGGLILIALFYLYIAMYQQIDQPVLMIALCIVAIALIVWANIQSFGYFKVSHADIIGYGPLNPNTASVLLALCLPAFFRPLWFIFIPLILGGIYYTHSIIGFIIVIPELIIYLIKLKSSAYKTILIFVLSSILIGFYIFKGDYLYEDIKKNERWYIWRTGLKMYQSFPLKTKLFGQGLNTWKEVFPVYSKRDKGYGDAQNEYLQITCELGIISLGIILSFIIYNIISFQFIHKQVQVLMAMVGIFISCLGYCTLHIPSLILICSVWFGMYFQSKKEICDGSD